MSVTLLTMSVTLLITCLVVVLPLNGVCGSDSNSTREAADVNSAHYSSDYFEGIDVYNYDNEYHYPDSNYYLATDVVDILLFTVACAGVCGNVAVLVGWCAETAFHPTVFLIKCLAVSDILLLILWLSFVLFFFPLEVLFLALHCFRLVTAHTTLGMVFTRWLPLHKPLGADSLLTKRRVVVGYVLMWVWCLVQSILPILSSPSGRDVRGIVMLAVRGMYLVLTILLVAFSVSLVLKLRSLKCNSGLGQQQQQQLQQQQQEERPMAQLRYLVKAVLCVSISTVLVCLAGIVLRVLVSSAQDTLCGLDKACAKFWFTVSLLLEAMNSSVNIVYYVIYAPRFRQLCRGRCCCCCQRRSEDCLETQPDAMQLTAQSGVH